MPCRVDIARTWGWIQDPYTHPAAHIASCVSFCVAGAAMWGLAFLVRKGCLQRSRNIQKALVAAYLVRGVGYVVEGIARIVFNERDGLGLALSARTVVVLSLYVWVVLSNGLGEAVFPNRRMLWLTAWVSTSAFLPVTLTLLFLFSEESAVVAMCAAAFADFYWAAMWFLVMTFGIERNHLWCRFAALIYSKVIALLIAVAGAIVIALTESACGPRGHGDCYEKCRFNGGGWHDFLGLFFGFFGHLFAFVFWVLDAVPVDVQWPPSTWEYVSGEKRGRGGEVCDGQVAPSRLPPAVPEN
ncbi:unnamed protein product [Symbiodinium natans]|uniref:Transmembrane protein n=1 Tax=Symbiodinium natans TaxID=878477 RepID=A0A812RK78_9DINO|nr:unnamed protein product [Symbiodinium natans]